MQQFSFQLNLLSQSPTHAKNSTPPPVSANLAAHCARQASRNPQWGEEAWPDIGLTHRKEIIRI